MMERRLFAVGDLNVDVLQELGRKPEFGEEHSLKDLELSIGGNAANFAVIASKMGLRPILVSVLGKDFATGFLEKDLRKAGVKARFIRSKKENSFSIIMVDRKGERSIQSIKNCFEDATSEKFGRLLLPQLKEGDIVLFGGFFHLCNLRKGFQSLLRKIKAKGATICFDTCFDTFGIWKLDSFLPFFDYLFVNEVELQHIAKGSSVQSRIDRLFEKGAKRVVLKQGKKGASLFVKGFKPKTFAAVKAKAVDTTGAGDAFNAGFAFGLLNNWSLNNCVKAANFVAAKKIQVHGLAAPKAGAVERFIAVNNQPTLIVVRNSKEMSRLAAQRVINLLKRKPNASIALPTGETPKQMYKLLVQAYRKRQVSFAKAKLFAVDEYVGLQQKDKSSFSYFLVHHLFGKVNARKQNTFLLNGAAKDLRKEAARHEAAIRKSGLDLCILGIAPNGHVGFNEPGSCPYGATRTVLLKPATRKKNARDFPGRKVPKKAITIGLRTIRDNSTKILLLASGKPKRRAVLNSLKSNDFMKWPAVALKQHKNFMLIVDRAAARKK